MPSDATDLLIASNPHLSPDDVIRLKRLRGTDRPVWVQYRRWAFGSDGARPLPEVMPLSPVEVELLDDATTTLIEIPLEDALVGTDGWRTAEGFLTTFASVDAGLAARLGAAPIVANALSDDVGLIEAIRLATRAYPAEVAQLFAAEQRRAREALTLECVATCAVVQTDSGRVLRATLGVGLTRLFFTATDAHHLSALGSVLVTVRPASEDGARGLLDPSHSDAFPLAVVDDPAKFTRDLAPSLVDIPANASVTWTLSSSSSVFSLDSAGTLRLADRHRVDGQAGTRVVPFTAKVGVETDAGWREKTLEGAVVVDLGPLIDPAANAPGVVHALVGDRAALGYSSAFQQPIYDLLFGAPDMCGDGRRTGSEACDDANLDDNDGCSATCTLEGESFVAQMQRTAIAFLRQPGRLWNTLFLMVPALLLALGLAIPLGVFAATRRGWLDAALNGSAFAAMSVPVFWLGMMAVALFAEQWRLFPATGTMSTAAASSLGDVVLDRLWHAVLPVAMLCAVYTGRWMRYVRGAVLEILPFDYVRTARAKGLSEARVIWRHVLRNALIPVVTIVALSLPSLFGGALLTETVFSWPGVGSLQFEAVMKGDLYLAILIFLILAALVFVANAAADLLYAVIDPRVRAAIDKGQP